MKKTDIVSLSVYSLLATTFGIFGPLELYVTNISEFWFSINEIWWIILLGGILIFTLCFALGLLFSEKKRDIYICLLFGLGLGLYVQGNYINADYNVLNGESIDWSSYTGIAIVNTLIWVGCIIAPFIIRHLASRYWRKIINYTATIILLIQIVTLGVLGIATDFDKKGDNTTILTTEGEYDLSKNKNIVVFILDAYDSSYFTELLEEYPQLTSIFSDFTYYPDTVGGATRTTLAIPALMTGKAWTKPVSYNDYLENSFAEAELYNLLEKYNYDMRVYTNSNLIPETQSNRIRNIELGNMKSSSNYLLSKYIYKLTAFRYMPHLLKSQFWFYGEVFNQLKESSTSEIYNISDANYYQKLIKETLSTNCKQNAFRVYHLMGAHPPYTINENVEKTSSTRQQQARGVLKIIEEYITQCKKMNIYDNTTFIIMADHGEVGYEQNPLFMLKMFGENKPFQINYAPISFFNLHTTMMSIITGDYESYDNTIFDFEEGESVKRLFYRNGSKGNKTKVIEYEVNGYAWDPKAITETGNIYIGNSGNLVYDYKLGTELVFGSNGNATKYLESGFSADEADHTWAVGTKATIRLDLSRNPKSDLLVRINASPYSVAGPQHMTVFANSTVVHEGTYYGSSCIEFQIPVELVRGNTLNLEFAFPNAISPSEASKSNDGRALAFDFYKLSIDEGTLSTSDEKKNYELGTDIVFTDEDDGTRYFEYGISYTETSFAWSYGKYAQLVLDVGNIDRPIMANITLHSVFNGEQHVIIKCNNDATLFDNIVDSKNKKIDFTIPSNCIKGNVLVLNFEYPDATSPYALGHSVDSRELAIAFKTITFSEIK